MNTLNVAKPSIEEPEILKYLLSHAGETGYRAEKELSQRLKDKNVNVNYPTIRRAIIKLEKEGYVQAKPIKRKNGSISKRGKTVELTFKGMAYLILNAELEEPEIARLLGEAAPEGIKRFELSQGSTEIQQIGIDTIREAFEKLRSRINLEYFDEAYAKMAITDMIVELQLDKFVEWQKKAVGEIKHDRTERKAKRRRALKEARYFPVEWIDQLGMIYEHMKAKREQWNEKINMLGPFVKEFKRISKKK